MKHTDLIDDIILIKDWCQALNPGTAPAALTRGSHVLVRWKCHKCGRIWDAKVKNRFNGGGCTCDAIARKTAALRRTLVEKHGSNSSFWWVCSKGFCKYPNCG